jgi:Zn-dependent protease
MPSFGIFRRADGQRGTVFSALLSIQDILLLFPILIMSLSFHEAAHAWSANRLGDPTARMLGRLTLNPLSHIDWIGTVLFPLVGMYSGLPLLGWAKPVPVDVRYLRHPRRDFAMVALAGPVSNLVLAVGATVILLTYEAMNPARSLTSALLFEVVRLNVSLAVFNLIPVPPLDGGNVVAGFVPETIARGLDALRPWGFLVLYALMYYGYLDAIIRPIQGMVMGWLGR